MGVPQKDVEMAGVNERRRKGDVNASLFDAYHFDGFLLTPLLHYDHLLRKSPSVHDQLIDVDTGRRVTLGLQNLAVPVRIEGTGRRSRRTAGQLEIVEILAGALENRHGDELRQHVVNLERHLRPMTIRKQLAVQRERDRGRRIERRSEEHTSELQSLAYLVCRLLLEKKKNII